MCDCASRTLRSAFAPLTRFLQSSSMTIYGTHLKWRHWKPRDLIMCSQTITLGMRRSSFNVRSEENVVSSNCFRIATSTSSSGGLRDRGLSPIETRVPSDARKREYKHHHRSTTQVHCEFQ
jgi:hypothetical protein